MVLADTSIWVGHLRKGEPGLAQLLEEGHVAVHPFVLGELACGHLKNRAGLLALLRALPQASRQEDEEILFFIEQHNFPGRGLGLVDVHLLASCMMDGLSLWTRDKRLRQAADELTCSFQD